MKKQKVGKTNRRMCDMKFSDFRRLLEEYGYELDRRTNSTHAKFVNTHTGHSVVVSGYKGTGGKVSFPIVHKTLKACGIKW